METLLYTLAGLCILLGIIGIWFNLTYKRHTPEVKRVPIELENSKPKTSEPVYDMSNISEPVITWVEQVKANPSRIHFTFVCDGKYAHLFKFTDTTLKTKFVFTTSVGWLHLNTHNWITEPEIKYAIKELSPIYEERKQRYDHIKGLRKQRELDKERAKYKELICGK